MARKKLHAATANIALLVALSGVSTVPFSVLAQDSAAATERVVVSASRLELAADAVAQHVTVLSRNDIVSGGYASMAELLATASGLVVDRSGRSGGYGSLYLRGADPSHVVILVDGIRQNDALSSRGSAVDLTTLTIADIERVEIVRGGSSIAYGDALAGFIHIHTRIQAGTVAGAQADAGGDGRVTASVRVGTASLGASAVSSEDGDERGSVRNTAANLAWRMAFGPHAGVQLNARVTRTRNTAFPDDSGGPLYAVGSALEQRVADSVQASARGWWRPSDGAALEWSLARLERSEHDDNPGVAPGVRDPAGFPPVATDTRYRTTQLQLLWRQRLTSALAFVLGADVEQEQGAFDSLIQYGRLRIPARFEQSRTPLAGFSELRYESEGWAANAGLRSLSATGYPVQWHPALSVQRPLPSAGALLGGSITTATKLPSFYALGHPLIGNPQLRPEQARQVELYVASLPETALSYRLTAFRSRYRDLIDFDAGPPPQLVNRTHITVDGMEASGAYRFASGLRFDADATRMEVSGPPTAPPLRFRPRWQGGARLALPIAAGTDLQLSARYLGRRFDSSIATGDRWLGGYAWLNATVVTTVRNAAVKDLRLSFALDNVLDRRAEEVIGSPIGARRIRIGVHWSWA